jgi:3'-phosphoadenosine 5'-phosphosulfate sulfotransferase (PAPS reductase)/FAD synthetase
MREIMRRITDEERNEIIERNAYFNRMSYEDKVDVATERVIEWTEICADHGKNYAVSVGGLDSIVLLLFVRKILGKCDGISVSALEDTSIQQVHRDLGVIAIKPDMNFVQVLNTYGFPVLSKQIAADIEHLQVKREDATKRLLYYNHALMTGETGPWGGFVHSDSMQMDDELLELFGGNYAEDRPDLNCKVAPFKVSDKCCGVMKEAPSIRYQQEHDIFPFLGLMQVEGGQRRYSLRKYGCNYVGKSTARSCPFNYFSRQDLLTLALDLKAPVPEIYGEIIRDSDGMLRTTKAQRTGCNMCGFGIQLESRPHRFDRLKERNPKYWEFLMYRCVTDETGTYGWGRVLDYLGIEWENEIGQIRGQMNIFDFIGGGAS